MHPKSRTIKASYALGTLLFLGACAGSGADYRPIVDQPNAGYENDLRECQNLAQSSDYDNGETRTQILAGATIGSLLGATQGLGNAMAGSVIGGALGATPGIHDTWQGRKKIVVNCLQGRGHKVIG